MRARDAAAAGFYCGLALLFALLAGAAIVDEQPWWVLYDVAWFAWCCGNLLYRITQRPKVVIR